jgi:hypothetical protein
MFLGEILAVAFLYEAGGNGGITLDYKALHPASYWFPAWLTFYPEEGGDMFLRNVG